jgi:hypothetical protein
MGKHDVSFAHHAVMIKDPGGYVGRHRKDGPLRDGQVWLGHISGEFLRAVGVQDYEPVVD